MKKNSVPMILALVLAMFVLYLLADRLQVLAALINGRLVLPGRSDNEFILQGLSARFVSGSIIALCLIVSAFVAVAGLRLVKTNGKARSASDPKDGKGQAKGVKRPWGTKGNEHYAFAMSRDEFDAAFQRIKDNEVSFGDSFHTVSNNTGPGNEVGARGPGPTIYMFDPNHHLIEIRTYD